MRLLLDTHAFLWWVNDGPSVSRRARSAIGDAANECFLSLASSWEIAIKVSLGKLKLPGEVSRFVQEQLEVNGFSLLAVSLEHVSGVADLPFHHGDPFDRLLAAQARYDQLAVVSSDPTFTKYGVKRVW